MLVLSIIINTVTVYLSVLSFMLFLRVVYPLLFSAEEGVAYSFIFASTEPVMMPIRSVLDKTETFGALPIDFSCLFAIGIVMVVRIILTFI